jgi:hypothetical protein
VTEKGYDSLIIWQTPRFQKYLLRDRGAGIKEKMVQERIKQFTGDPVHIKLFSITS